MRFKVWKEGIKAEDGDVLLRLFDDKDYGVDLAIVDEKGDPIYSGYLICFKNKYIVLPRGVNPKLGLPLNFDGELLFDVEIKGSEKTKKESESKENKECDCVACATDPKKIKELMDGLFSVFDKEVLEAVFKKKSVH